MDSNVQATNVSFLTSSLRRQQYANGVLAILCAILIFMYIGAKGDVREILTPTSLSRDISVKGKTMDREYLEEMGVDIAPMILTVNPKTADANKERLMRIAHPSLHAALSNRVALLAERMQRDNAAQVFWPQQVLADPDHNRVAVYGLLTTYVNDKKTSTVDKAYVVGLSWSGNRIWLSQFDEGPLDDPFHLKPTPSGSPAIPPAAGTGAGGADADANGATAAATTSTTSTTEPRDAKTSAADRAK